MFTSLALNDLSHLFPTGAVVIPVAGGIFTGLSFAIFRGRLAELTHLAADPSKSLMNFSSQGTLRCVCGAKNTDQGGADRRQFCRSCGCEVVMQNEEALTREYTKKDIKLITSSLRRAVIRASHLELPPSVTTVEELHRYLESSDEKSPRTPPTSPTTVEQAQLR